MKIILASKSPRRRELLGNLAGEIGFEFDIITKETDESVGDMHPLRAVEELAIRKGSAVAEDHGDVLVISSDTLVERDGVALGKPVDNEDAYNMLSSLSGRAHNVHTGIAVHYHGRVYSGVASTAVRFMPLTDKMIKDYIATGEPSDKAGAYGIQGGAGKFVTGYDGEFDTVVGFNITLLKKLLKEALGDISLMKTK